MKLTITTVLALVSTLALGSAKIDPKLAPFAQKKTSAKVARVVALMDLTIDSQNSPRRYDRQRIPAYFKYLSQRTWSRVEGFLKAQPSAASTIQIVRGFWINSSFSANVTPEGLRLLAAAPGVTKIYLDDKIIRDPYGRTDSRRAGSMRRNSPFFEAVDLPYDLKAIGLDQVMTEFPQLDGKGVVLGHIDTGVDAKHPALTGKIVSFYNAATTVKAFVEPFDGDQHGTHTAGTMVGGDRHNNMIGVAPGAKLVVALGLTEDGDTYSAELAAMEHMLDPDHNPGTVDLPRAVNNSWHCSGAPDMELFYRAITAWETAGILPVFSAGNQGRNGMKTITPPHEHPLAFAVAATDEKNLVTDFSSRGPGVFNGKETQKPDLAAPGANIRSSIPGGSYEAFSGTSMAAPHVAGASALLWQINPTLTPVQIRQIFLRSLSATNADGSPGTLGQWNPFYGFGRMNVYAAAKMAMATLNPNPVESVASGARPLMEGLMTSPRAVEAVWIARNNRAVALSNEDFAYAPTMHDRGWVSAEQLWR